MREEETEKFMWDKDLHETRPLWKIVLKYESANTDPVCAVRPALCMPKYICVYVCA